MHRAISGNGLTSGDQCLCRDMAAEHPGRCGVPGPAAEDVGFNAVEGEDLGQ